MSVTKIKLKRSFSSGNNDILAALSAASNMNFAFGEPLWFKSAFYGSPKLFVGDDNASPVFVGPYFAGDGIVMDTTNTSATLGRIAMQYPIPSLSGNGGKTLRANSSGTALEWGNTLTLRTMNGEQLTDSTLGDINIHDGFYFPNAVQDYDGNWYGAVVIGDQVWLGENLRTTHYADGTAITEGGTSSSESVAYYYHAGNNSNNDETYGLLYNFPAVTKGQNPSASGIQGISPSGWHVSSYNDWTTLIDYLSKQKRFISTEYSQYPAVSKSISARNIWDDGGQYTEAAPGREQESNNKAGLGIPPSGAKFFESYVTDYSIGSNAVLWTCSENNNGLYSSVGWANNMVYVGFSSAGKKRAFSVRCVSDLTSVQFRNWYIEQYGSLQHIVAEDVQEQADWNQTDTTDPAYIKNKPTIPAAQVQSDWEQTDTGSADYIKNKPSLVEELNDLSDVDITPDVSQQTYFEDAVEDYDGNLYDAIIIGNQVWTAENYRSTHYNDGTAIDGGEIDPYSTNGYRAYPNGDSNNVNDYGLLYTYYAYTDENFSPNGWHVPSRTEWLILVNTLQVTYGYPCVKQMASTYGWASSSLAGSPGENQNTNNTSLFNLPPAGNTKSNTFGNIGSFATTGTENNAQHPIELEYNSVDINYSQLSKPNAISVRFICDITADEFRAKYALKGKVLIHDGSAWTDGEIPAQQQADWNQINNSAPDYIKNKPTIPDNVFVCTYNNNGMDKTPQEIYTAYSAGKLIIAQLGQSTYVCTLASSTTGTIEFTNIANPTDDNNICVSYIRYRNNYWSVGSKYLQVRLTSGTNIKTINGQSLLGSGALNMPGTLFYAYTDTPESTADKVVTLISPTTGFTNGSHLLLHFYSAVPAGNANTITIGNDQYMLSYHQAAITEAGIINAGDKALIVCYNSVAHIISVDRWGEDIASKQDMLVSGTNIKTINNRSLLGSGNIDTKEIVWCTYTETDSTNHTGTMSMTVAEIQAAVQAGNIVCLIHGDTVYGLTNKSNVAACFSRNEGGVVNTFQYYSSDQLWHYYSRTLQQELTSGTNIKTINNQSILGSGDIAIDQDYERVMTLSADTDMSTILNNTACNNANLLLQISADTVIDMDTYANHETYVVVQNTDSNAHAIKFDYSDDSIAAFIGSGEYIAGNNALQVTVPANAHVMISMRVMDGDAVLFKVDRVRLHMNPVTEAELSDDDVALVLKNNTTGELRYITLEDIQQYSPDLSAYTVKPFIRFTRGKNGKSVVIHKDQIASAQWATNNLYKVYCDTTAAGGFTISVGNWETTTSATVSWLAGDTLDSIVAQMTNGSYCWFSHVSGEDFIRVSCYCSSSSYNCTLANNTGGSVDDLSKYCRINGVVQSEVHRVWQGTDVATLFPNQGFTPANTVQYARNGYNMSYMCGGNLARFKAYYENNGSATYVAETTLSRMSKAGFNSCNDSGNADAQALYDKYEGSWDAYMEACMVQIDDTHTNGIEYKSYDNGEQSQFLASVETKYFDGSWMPAYPIAYNCAQKTDADLGAFNLPTSHELAVYMEDEKMAKINAAMSYINGTNIVNYGVYYWAVSQSYSVYAWFYSSVYGSLNRNYSYYRRLSARALAYLP